jgi:hypothetical protein
MHGVGRTVFQGNRIEEFQVEIIGLLENITPKQTVVLARLSGGPLAQTGILQGMSGSPVYIDGKLLGAVALGFPFSKEPIAGIQPIEAMIADAQGDPGASPDLAEARLPSLDWSHARQAGALGALAGSVSPEPVATPFGNLDSLLTPLSLSGFSSRTLDVLSPGLRRLGFSPLPGQSASSPALQVSGGRTPLAPGSMISVGLLSGDLNMTADGTVTLVQGNRIYAFGHRFLDTGSTELPFARSEVVALIPTLNSSFKLSSPREWIGTIVSDRATAVAGEIGRPAHTIPLTITVDSPRTGTHDYHFQVVNDRLLTPFITQTALFSVVDATERTLGRGTLQLEGRVDWNAPVSPLVIRDTFISDSGLVQQAATDAVVPIGFVLGGGFRDLHPKNIAFHITVSESKRQLRIAQAWVGPHDVHPGDPIEITALLQGENGVEFSRTATYRVPIGAPAGVLNFTVSDGNTLNFPEFAGLSQSSAQSPDNLIRTINAFRNSDQVYVRVWRPQPSFTISGPAATTELSDPPPSVALILADPSDSATTSPALTQTRGSAVAELSIDLKGYVITGAKTLQAEVKE